MPTYPNVPNEPGVPPVPRDPTAPIIDQITIAVSDAVIIARFFLGPQWGLFNSDGSNALQVSSTISVEFRGDATVTTAPLQAGGFVSYNKVQVPRLIRMSFAISGGKFLPIGINLGAPDNASFLQQLEYLRDNPILLTAVTPDAVYQNVTVVHFEYRRTAQNNATMLTSDVWLEEIREPGVAQFSSDNVQSPSSADPVNVGTVQPTSPGAFANELPPPAGGTGGFS